LGLQSYGHDVDTAVERAREVLRSSASSHGFVASSELGHYEAVFTRDVAFAAMGAHASGDPQLVGAVERSLTSLACTQSQAGQIANYFAPENRYWDYHESGSTDATCLYVVAATQHLKLCPNHKLSRQLWPHLVRASEWLAAQDANGFTLLDSPMGGDWMDSTLQRSGKLFYVNVCYLRALDGMAALACGKEQEHYARVAALLRRKLNFFFWPEAGEPYEIMLEDLRAAGLNTQFPHPVGPAAHAAAIRSDRSFYLSHVEGERRVDECDVLANVLAVLFDGADSGRAYRIMRYLHGAQAAHPYPARTYLTPLAPGDRWGMYKHDLDRFQAERWRNPPGAYHNGGVWPFIGGLYVTALSRVGLTREAWEAMYRLTAANRLGRGREWGFHEWIHAETGMPAGARSQTWSAGAYLLAHHTLTTGREPF
jgi:glycogen debranching enzyme